MMNINLPLDPRNAELAARFRAGDPSIAFDQLPAEVPPQWSQAIRQLESGNVDELLTLLRTDPFIISHPVITRELRHLHEQRLSRCLPITGDGVLPEHTIDVYPEEGLVRYRLRDGEEATAALEGVLIVSTPAVPYEPVVVLPPDVAHAEAALHRVIETFVSAMNPGWTLGRTRRARLGAPEKTDAVERLLIAFQYRRLRQTLDSPLGPFRLLKRRRDEETRADGPDPFVQRVASQITRTLNMGAGAVLVLYGNTVAFRAPLPPPPEEAAIKIATFAVNKRRVVKSRLIYGILGYYYRRAPSAVEDIVEETKRRYPSLLHLGP